MVVFDANFLIYFLDPKIKGGVGNNPRIDHLVATIQKTGERIIVPTPALSEPSACSNRFRKSASSGTSSISG